MVFCHFKEVIHPLKMLFKKYSTFADNRFLDSFYPAIKRYVNKMIYMSSSLSRVFFARSWNVCKDTA